MERPMLMAIHQRLTLDCEAQKVKDKVRQWRKRLSLSQAAAARKIGVSESTIRNYESGRTIPSLTEQLAMAAIERGLSPMGAPSSDNAQRQMMAATLKAFGGKSDPSMADAQNENGASTADAPKKKKPSTTNASKRKKPAMADAPKRKKPLTISAQKGPDGQWGVP